MKKRLNKTKVILKKLKKDLKTTPKENIEEQLESHGWLQELIENHLKPNENSFEFVQDYENKTHKNKFKNVTIRKKRLLSLTSSQLKTLLVI